MKSLKKKIFIGIRSDVEVKDLGDENLGLVWASNATEAMKKIMALNEIPVDMYDAIDVIELGNTIHY